jgi:hypothetical protein
MVVREAKEDDELPVDVQRLTSSLMLDEGTDTWDSPPFQSIHHCCEKEAIGTSPISSVVLRLSALRTHSWRPQSVTKLVVRAQQSFVQS